MSFHCRIVTALVLALVVGRSQAQYTVPDSAFAARLTAMVPFAMNGAVLDTLHPSVQALASMNVSGAGIYDLSGIQYFTGLYWLACTNNYLSTLPVLPNSIEYLECQGNDLVSFTNLPTSLVQLQCWENEITSLPALPPVLEWLVCYDNQLTSLPALPGSLTQLVCGDNLLTSLPTLPASLVFLYCSNNDLSGQLVALPTGLQVLACDQNAFTSLPALPPSLMGLTCSNNSLPALPALPASLRTLSCEQNVLTSLPALPSALHTLNCAQNQLATLPALPDSLLYLTCHNNQLGGLPALPNGLFHMQCLNNPIGVLPTLPDSLRFLYAANNGLSALPALPNGLTNLFAFDNQLTVLPALPDSLTLLNCGANLLTDLPTLPAGLRFLLVDNNPLTCLPVLPNTVVGVVCNLTGVTCLPNVPTDYSAINSNLGFPLTVCNVLSPCPFGGEAFTGNVFNDANGNGLKDGGEAPFTNAVIEAQPGDFLTAPDAAGNYVLPAAVGTFVLDGQDVLYHNRTTAPANITLAPLQIDSLNDIGYQAVPGIYDLVVDFTVTPARPGFDNNLYLTVENIGTEPALAAIALSFDAAQTWVSSSTAPDTQVGNNATWSANIPVGGVWATVVTLNTDAGIAIGTPLVHAFSAIPSLQDTTPANNTFNWIGTVVGAYDPNDKRVVPEAMSPAQVQAGEKLEYTIRFQNTGTFPAERVVITDTLSADLLWNTMELVSTSHTTDWYVHQGVLHFVMDPINLPDSVSDEPGSHGYVKFRMAPVSTLIHGDQVENVANIYFDFNEPVITNAAVFTVDQALMVTATRRNNFSIYPNPVEDLLTLQLDGPGALLELRAVDGRLLKSQRLSGTQGTLAMDELTSGLYEISVVYGNGQRVTQGVVKR